jgi:hypothetical protein
VPRTNAPALKVFASIETRRYYLGQSPYWIEFREELDYGPRKKLDGAAIYGYEREMAERGSDLDTSSNKLTFVTRLERVAPLRLALWTADWYIVAELPDGRAQELLLPDNLEERVGLFNRMGMSFATQLADLLDTHEADVAQERKEAEIAAGIREPDAPAEDADPNRSPSATPSGEPASAPQMLISATAPAGPLPSSMPSQNPSWPG